MNQRQWWLLAAMSGVLGLIVLDETIVSVSLPSIGKEFGLSASATHWVVNAYLLSFTCAVAIAGRLSDHFSRRSYFSAGAALFAGSSAMAALAPDWGTLIAARALQGIAAALIFPTSIALITAAFPPEKRGAAFGYQTTVGGIFMASGPLIGGFLTETTSWRMIFWISIPFVVAITVLLWLAWSPSYDGQSAKARKTGGPMEFAGPAFLVVALLSIVTTVMQGPSWGWLSLSTVCLFVLGLTMLALFLRRETRHPAPLLDLSMLKIPEFGGGAIIFAIFQFEKIAVFVFAAQYFQNVLGKSPIMSGVAVSLSILPTLATSILVGKSTDRLGSKTTLVRGVAIHGMAIIFLALATLQQNFILALVPLLFWGASMPSVAIPVRRVQINSVAKDKQGQASGISLTIQMLGGSLGFAACSALLSETKSYPLLFLVVGIVTLLILPIGMHMCGKPKTSGNAP